MVMTLHGRDFENESASRQEVVEEWGDTLDLLYSEYTTEVKKIISEEIKKFFSDKRYHIGGPIPSAIFNSPKYVQMVAFTTITEASLAIHAHFENESRRVKREFELLEQHVEIITSVIKECVDLNIPRPFSPGIILMYFEICEGQRIKLLN